MDNLTYIQDVVDRNGEVFSESQEEDDFIIALFVVVFDTKRGTISISLSCFFVIKYDYY